MVSLAIYFDFASPFCYVVCDIAHRLRVEGDLSIDWQPFEVIDYLPPRGAMPQNPAFVRRGEAMRAAKLAHEHGLTIHLRERLLNSNLALCAVEYMKDVAAGQEIPQLVDTSIRALFDAYYRDERDISDIATIVEVCSGFTVADDLKASLHDGRLRARVVAAKARALELGVVAVPTWIAAGYGVVGVPAIAELEKLVAKARTGPLTRQARA